LRAIAWHEERAAQVGVEDQVPVFRGDVERRLAHVAACVVHQNIDLPVGRLGGVRHLPYAGDIPHIELERHGPPAEALHSLAKSRNDASVRLVITRSAPARASACRNTGPDRGWRR